DGELASLEAGTDTRVLEFVARHQTFEPSREFVYHLEPVQRPTFAPSFAFNGLVELLAIDDTTLLALERGFVANKEKPDESRCTIRVFSVTLSGATDVSAIESLKEHQEIVPLKKTLVLDLSQAQGLSQELAPTLENFEGMTFGPRLPDGRASLVLVSDDNFSTVQRTWFLLFAIQ
ncbi:MAG TPA: esterase-like activity of phytase family protein, partial [Vicinamibacterales bacterium]